jgi:hypothetical protein
MNASKSRGYCADSKSKSVIVNLDLHYGTTVIPLFKRGENVRLPHNPLDMAERSIRHFIERPPLTLEHWFPASAL